MTKKEDDLAVPIRKGCDFRRLNGRVADSEVFLAVSKWELPQTLLN